MELSREIIEKIHAGFLGKVIGVRLGSPIEGMWYGKIHETYGEITDYLLDYDLYAADDDTNGPVFFFKGLEDGGHGKNMTAQDVGNAVLNYVPYEHGFFWWGGYGISTEHTAYQNLRAGVKAPESGSIELNGTTVAEQIGGQIFIDTWGLVAPGNPDLAAKLAEKAASVTHGGNGIYGGIFIAVCISYAFVEKDIRKIINKALSYIPADCEYARVVNDMIKFQDEHPTATWRECYWHIRRNWGYDRYPGNCHIIPNTAIIILSLLYGEGDYSKTVCICNMCGFDTDCNAGNVGAIMGVLVGMEGIEEKWIKPINDLLISSSVLGYENIFDVSNESLYIAKQAAKLAGCELCEPYKTLAEKDARLCHFEFPSSTHAFNVLRVPEGEDVSFAKVKLKEDEKKPKPNYVLENSDKTARIGTKSLRVKFRKPKAKEKVFVYRRTYYHPSDFTDSRYDPSFSPIVYPGQVLHGSVYIPSDVYPVTAFLCYYDERNNVLGYGDKVVLKNGEWTDLEYRIPETEKGLVVAAGFCFEVENEEGLSKEFNCYIDNFYVTGKPEYSIDFSIEKNERWHWKHIEVSQFSYLRGLFYIQDGMLNISGPDYAEGYTGGTDWSDYTCKFTLIPVSGKDHTVNVRVQGAMKSYAIGFSKDEFCILKNDFGYKKLVGEKFKFEPGKEYKIEVKVQGNKIKAKLGNTLKLEYTDEKSPYLKGCIGVSTRTGSHTRYKEIKIK